MIQSKKEKILLFADWYAPGYKAGGPIRSCVNFVHHMRLAYEVYVFTSDRDLGDKNPYQHIERNRWNEVAAGAFVYYASPEMTTWRNFKLQLKEIAPAYVYCNSMFSWKFSILPLLAAKSSGSASKIILSPRGMLRSSAIQFKSKKKKVFLSLFRAFGLHRNLFFHAADNMEADDVRKYFGSDASVVVIPNLPGGTDQDSSSIQKKPGFLKMIFVGRIHPVKNLHFLLELMRNLTADIELSIVGSREDEAYWQRCEAIARELPATIKTNWCGEMPPENVQAQLKEHHLFVLPTCGENYGHAIAEALASAKPVLISDQTPWRNLQASGAGWDLPLNEPSYFQRAIEEAAAWDQHSYDQHCRNAVSFFANTLHIDETVEKYRSLFSRNGNKA